MGESNGQRTPSAANHGQRFPNSGGWQGGIGPRSYGDSTGQRTPGGAIMDGRGRDGQHRDSGQAVDNGMRRTVDPGKDVGQRRGGDLQDEVPKPDCRADISTEDHDGDLDDSY